MTEEERLHIGIAQYLEACLYPSVFWTTFPLGGGGTVRGKMLKARGTRVGTPDILIIDGGRPLWLEIKTLKGRVSPEQLTCHHALRLARSDVAIVRSIEETEIVLKQWNVPLRAGLA